MQQPSITSQVVAITRARLKRPHSPEGDPRAQEALCAGMRFSPPPWLEPSIAARTRFIDAQVTSAIAAGLRQIVICGAGYDDRALRFRTSGVRFFELDHPATQADKARLLTDLSELRDRTDIGELRDRTDIGELRDRPDLDKLRDRTDLNELRDRADLDELSVAAGEPGLALAAVDFRTDDVGTVLKRAGHRPDEPSLFVAEGLLVYLDRSTCARLLTALAEHATPGSVLAVSLATHADGFDSADVVAAANSRRRAAVAEPWRTILPAAEHLALLSDAGWRIAATEWSPVAAAEVSYGRRSLLVTAEI